jgi:hypothetical protein
LRRQVLDLAPCLVGSHPTTSPLHTKAPFSSVFTIADVKADVTVLSARIGIELLRADPVWFK